MSPVVSLLAAHAHFADLGTFEWMLVGTAAVVAAWSIWRAVAYTLRPGEDAPDHVKRSILDGAARRPEGPA